MNTFAKLISFMILLTQIVSSIYCQQLITIPSINDDDGYVLTSHSTNDINGNRIIVGQFRTDNSFDFDPGDDVVTITDPNFGAHLAGFVASYNVSGELNYVFPILDADIVSNSSVREVDVDAEGNLYIIGTFSGKIDVDPSVQVFEIMAATANTTASFIASYTPTGELRYGFLLPYSFSVVGDQGTDRNFQVDDMGNIYFMAITNFGAGDADPGPNEYILDNLSRYLLSYDQNGNFRYGHQLPDDAEDLGANRNGEVVVVGAVSSFFPEDYDFDPGEGIANIAVPEGIMGYAVSYHSDGSLNYLNTFEGEEQNTPFEMVLVGDDGQAYIIGKLSGSVDFDPGAGITELIPDTFEPDALGDIFIASYNSSGDLLEARQMQDVVGMTSWETFSDAIITLGGDLIIAVFQQLGSVNYGTDENPIIIPINFNDQFTAVMLTIDGSNLSTVSVYSPGAFPLRSLNLSKSYDCNQYTITGLLPVDSEFIFAAPAPNETVVVNTEEPDLPVSILLTLDADDEFEEGCELITSLEEKQYLSAESLKVFPNPAFSEVHLQLTESAKENAVISLYDSRGVVLKIEKWLKGTSDHKLDLTNLPTGVYHLFYRNSTINYHQLITVIN